MMRRKKVALFDPSLLNNQSEQSINLGDVIIYEAIEKNLREFFHGYDFTRISSHQNPSDKLLNEVQKSSFVFFGGTNVLSSDLKTYNQWKLPIQHRLMWPFKFPVNNVILMGVGWWQYQNSPTAYTRAFYRRALSGKFMHSVRDSYTEQKMKQLGFDNVLNTGCPTMWELDGLNVASRLRDTENCLFTLTDYMRNPVFDDKVIEEILNNYKGKVFFFPQGSMDLEYISSLSCYQKNRSRFTIVNRTFEDYVSILSENDVDYIGTRLHAGIKALQLKRSALILAVDNRAKEISYDTGLPVISRDEISKLSLWINGVGMFEEIKMPVGRIEQWKEQFPPN